jgi:hypothetical protein
VLPHIGGAVQNNRLRDSAVDTTAIVGVSLFMGGETTTSRAVLQSAGHAYRLRGQLLKDAFFRAGPMQRLLLRYSLPRSLPAP